MDIETIKNLAKFDKVLAKWESDSENGLGGEMFTVPGLIEKYPEENIKASGLVQKFYERFPMETGGEITLNGHRYKITAIDYKIKPAIPYKIEALP